MLHKNYTGCRQVPRTKTCIRNLTNIRIKNKWNAINIENKNTHKAKANNKNYKPETFENGDTRKQLLARSRYPLYKIPSNWTQNQNQRTKILFREY